MAVNGDLTKENGDPDAELAQLMQAGMGDPRVARGLSAFRAASARVPLAVVTYSPTTYSTSGNS